MKRYIKSSLTDEVFLRDTLELTIELPLSVSIEGSNDYKFRFDSYTTVDNFRMEVVEMLKKKYKFEVLKAYNDKYGWTTDRLDSTSIYANTFYDLRNAKKIAQSAGIPVDKLQSSCKVECFIHLTISDHAHEDVGDVMSRQFKEDNARRATAGKDSLALILKDERIRISQQIYRDYKAGLQELETKLLEKIQYWVIQYNREKK